jgi:hypothetical protein
LRTHGNAIEHHVHPEHIGFFQAAGSVDEELDLAYEIVHRT